ncbi:MAG: lipopolysaccharide biosynthesis protein RfbH [Eubacterium sp.]|nr:lipopolysaccharide biosynthesis protein RfbH [Eubacterium sp.]
MDIQQKEMHDEILALVKKYYQKFHQKKNDAFRNGDRIAYSGRIYDAQEIVNLVDAALEFWLTQGRYTDAFEAELAEYLDTAYCSLVNSGSSANLAAFMALTSEELGERRIKRGDEVITVAAGFPTTVAPIVQYGAVPVFVDVTIPEYNIQADLLEEAVSDRTKAVFLAHTLGNPFAIQRVKDFCDKYHLWLLEDNCDALGSEYYYREKWRKTGSIGDISTCSFYPPHHMTMGEGGAVCTNSPLLHRLINSYRDWGRDCWCRSGMDDTCKHRYTQQFGELPPGYDHKYVYSHFGYNLKATDLQAAIGCAQLKKLPGFAAARQKNWEYLRRELDELHDKIILPAQDVHARPSWFGFLMTVRENAGFTRDDLAGHLEGRNIQTRYLFAGNLLKQPCFDEMRKTGTGYRVVGTLEKTDQIMKQSLWIGVYPGMTQEKLDYMVREIKRFAGQAADKVRKD